MRLAIVEFFRSYLPEWKNIKSGFIHEQLWKPDTHAARRQTCGTFDERSKFAAPIREVSNHVLQVIQQNQAILCIRTAPSGERVRISLQMWGK